MNLIISLEGRLISAKLHCFHTSAISETCKTPPPERFIHFLHNHVWLCGCAACFLRHLLMYTEGEHVTFDYCLLVLHSLNEQLVIEEVDIYR